MQFKSIILAIVASAVAIQAANPPATYDTCINEISKVFEGTGGGDPIKEITYKTHEMGCGVCFSNAVIECGFIYVTGVNTDQEPAKNCYTQVIEECKRGGNFVPAPAPAAA